jgi:peptidyl-prolyl cis-trans isomerase A (cyclophilin A)
MSESPRILLNTPDGDLTVEVDLRAAPQTAAHFLEFLHRGYINNSWIYRIVTPANGQRSPAISAIQFGWLTRSIDDRLLPPVPHEPTGLTGLRHLDGSISLARAAAGTGGCTFFFCIGDQPALDEGGGRTEDGLGFAAFGRLVGGRAVLTSLFEKAEENEMLVNPVRIGGRVLRRTDF